jgi:hypothetical protein
VKIVTDQAAHHQGDDDSTPTTTAAAGHRLEGGIPLIEGVDKKRLHLPQSQ